MNARYAACFQGSDSAYPFDDTFPPAQVRQVTPSTSGTEFDITFALPHSSTLGQTESNSVIGGFCSQGTGTPEQLCDILEATGFQGPVTTALLIGCSCQEST